MTLDELDKIESHSRSLGLNMTDSASLISEVRRLKRMTEAMAKEIADKRYDPQSMILPRDTQESVLVEYD